MLPVFRVPSPVRGRHVYSTDIPKIFSSSVGAASSPLNPRLGYTPADSLAINQQFVIQIDQRAHTRTTSDLYRDRSALMFHSRPGPAPETKSSRRGHLFSIEPQFVEGGDPQSPVREHGEELYGVPFPDNFIYRTHLNTFSFSLPIQVHPRVPNCHLTQRRVRCFFPRPGETPWLTRNLLGRLEPGHNRTYSNATIPPGSEIRLE